MIGWMLYCLHTKSSFHVDNDYYFKKRVFTKATGENRTCDGVQRTEPIANEAKVVDNSGIGSQVSTFRKISSSKSNSCLGTTTKTKYNDNKRMTIFTRRDSLRNACDVPNAKCSLDALERRIVRCREVQPRVTSNLAVVAAMNISHHLVPAFYHTGKKKKEKKKIKTNPTPATAAFIRGVTSFYFRRLPQTSLHRFAIAPPASRVLLWSHGRMDKKFKY